MAKKNLSVMQTAMAMLTVLHIAETWLNRRQIIEDVQGLLAAPSPESVGRVAGHLIPQAKRVGTARRLVARFTA